MSQDKKSQTNSAGLNPFGDLSAMLEQFQVPGVDMTAFIEARRKDVEALAQANQAAYEAMQALARTQSDMLAQAMQGMQASAQGLAGGAAGMPDPAKQAEVAREAWQKMLADVTTLAEMAYKSQAEALASLGGRAKENIEEVQQMLRPKQG